ncbi:hypothetical protein Tco_1127575 [Tanacetum coccineum]
MKLPPTRIWYDEDVHDLKSVEKDFPAIVFNDSLTSDETLSCEPTTSSLNDEIDFRILFDDSDDEDYTINTAYPLTWIRRIDQILSNFKAPIRHVAPLPPREQRHPFLRYQGLEYTDADIADFEERMVMEHRDDAGVVVFTSRAWGRLFDTRGPLVETFELEAVYSSLGITYRGGDGVPWMMAHSIAGRSQAPEKVTVTALFYLRGLDVGLVNIPYLLARYLKRFAARERAGSYFWWTAWVAMEPERQPDAAAGAPADVGDPPIVNEGNQAVLAPVQGPQQPPPPPAPARTMPQRMARLEEDVHEIRGALTEQCEVIDAMARDFSRFSTWVTTGLGRMMDRARVTYTPYSQTHMPYQRRVRQRTGEAITLASQQDQQQPDP